MNIARSAHRDIRKGEFFKKICFTLMTLLIAVVMMELALRIFIKESDLCSGTLFGVKLPPFKIAPVNELIAPQWTEADDRGRGKAPEVKVELKEGEVSTDDLFGIFREDELLGYTNLENTTSMHNWWQTNNIGARSRRDATRKKPAAKRRIIVFGDSFTNCSHIEQEKTWPYLMERGNPDLEVLNFGVDGYSTGQCLLRYRIVRDEIDYDRAIFLFVPSCDLERDVNTYRRLMGWESWKIMPRFVIEDKVLTLIRGPYKTAKDFCHENKGKLSERCLKHLRKYDALYIPSKYENFPILGDFILGKLLVGAHNSLRENHLRKRLSDPESEAMMVSREIFKIACSEASREGKKFLLIVLPRQDEIAKYRNEAAFCRSWDMMMQCLAGDHLPCIDMMDALLHVPKDQFDKAQDGYHNGEKTHAAIADIIAKALADF